MALLFWEAPSRVHFRPPVVLPVHAILKTYFRKYNTSLSFSVLSMIKKQIFQAKMHVKRSPQPCSKDLKPALDLDFLFLLMTTRLRLNCYIPLSCSFILSIGIIWAKPWTHHPVASLKLFVELRDIGLFCCLGVHQCVFCHFMLVFSLNKFNGKTSNLSL